MRLSSIVRAMKAAVLTAALLATTSVIIPGAAVANSDSEYLAELKECLRNADPRDRDECVSNARNWQGRGNGAAKKADETDTDTPTSDVTAEDARAAD